MRHLFALIILHVVSTAVMQAQVAVTGRVLDERTGEPLAFVHLLPVGERDGATTDIDGRFRIEVSALPVLLRFSYVGYAGLDLSVNDAGPHLVRMRRGAVELREVDITPTDNPAHRIIERVHAGRKVNDNMRNRAHRYTSYSKTVFTAAMDSALLGDSTRLASLDTSDREAVDWLEKHHLLLIESATSKQFIPPASEKEEVLAMRVSGLKDPSLLAMVASTKTFSIYQPQIIVNDKAFLSPIGPNSTDHYLFVLQDTLYEAADSVFVISYQPRSGKNFTGLKGVLWVNTDGYALQNVIAEPVEREGGTGIKLQQQFKRIRSNGTSGWFPVQLNTFLYFDFMQVNSWKVMGIGRAYLKDIELDASIAKKDVRGPDLVMDKLAARRDDHYWAALRTDTLQEKDLRTYHVVDSVSEAEGLETKLKWLDRLTTGRAPIGPIDLRIDRLIAFNGYEGLRLGAGAATNAKVSRYASLGGYFAYGFQDEAWKYGGDLTITPRPGRELELTFAYANDVEESGGVAFPGRPATFSTESYRLFYMDRMDRIERFSAQLAFRVNNSLKLWFGTDRTDRLNVIGYEYAKPAAEGVTVLQDRFLTGGVTAGFRFAFRERIVRLPDRQMNLGTRWPILQAQVWRSFEGIWEGDLATWRASAQVEKTFRVRQLGDLSVRVLGGVADTKAPYPFLFNLRGTNGSGLLLATQNTFETMHPNEFLADHYLSLHVRHSFGNLLFKGKKFRPVPVVVGSAVWGGMSDPGSHRGYTFRPLNDGYYEAGLQIDQVLKMGMTGFGVGAFYRLGPYALPEAMDNLALKMTLTFAF
ncbi:MAG: carboxypeptidase-like regulatory domain-containing protein [Flavobacteriales bacterium]|nr:carboxypeptidase-like regulatory domain-containing protein [Flavobacteriales bacterium]